MPNVTMDVQKSGYGLEELKEYAKQSSQRVITENEDKSKGITNDSFYNSNKFVGKDLFWQNLDLTYLIDKPDGYLQGKLSEPGDVDYYGFSLLWYRSLSKVDKYNLDITITLDHIPEGCDYELVLYDENGNQVGIGTDNDQGGKSITIPNWSMNNNNYTVKVFAKDGSPVSEDEYYHLSFQTKQADKDHGAYKQMQESQEYLPSLREKAYKGEDITAEKEALKKIQEEYDAYYAEQMEKLHQEQAKEYLQDGEIPSREQIDEWLEKLAAGEELTEQEMGLLNIFATAQEIDCATGKMELDTTVKDNVFSFIGLDRDDSVTVEITCTVEPSGETSVEGMDDEDLMARLEMALKRYADKMLDIYLNASPEILNLDKHEQRLLRAGIDIARFLHKATGGRVNLDDLTVEKGIIKGLPSNLHKLLNNPGNNQTYQEYRQEIMALKDYEKRTGENILSGFNAKFWISGGKMGISE